MRKILWNNKAKLDYYSNIDFLLEKWSKKKAQAFIDEVRHIEFILKQGNVDFQNTNIPHVKRVVLRKQITLFYRIINEKTIEFLRFWNNARVDQNL